jgi:hypothetical protein
LTSLIAAVLFLAIAAISSGPPIARRLLGISARPQSDRAGHQQSDLRKASSTRFRVYRAGSDGWLPISRQKRAGTSFAMQAMFKIERNPL